MKLLVRVQLKCSGFGTKMFMAVVKTALILLLLLHAHVPGIVASPATEPPPDGTSENTT